MSNRFSRKAVFLLILIALILITILLSALFFLNRTSLTTYNQPNKFTKEVNSEILKFGKYFNASQVNNSLKIINDSSASEKDRFEALKSLAFHFSSAYSVSHDPEIRKNAEIVKSYAAENFSELYKEDSGIFDLTCADPTCGDKPDEELKSIQATIFKLTIPAQDLDTIKYNFEQAMYIPTDNIDEKLYGFELAITHLESLNNSEASAAASNLRGYIEKKYADYLKSIDH